MGGGKQKNKTPTPFKSIRRLAYFSKAQLVKSINLLLIELTLYTIVSKFSRRHKVMNEKFKILKQIDKWTLVPLKSKMNLVDCKWSFKIKQRSDEVC